MYHATMWILRHQSEIRAVVRSVDWKNSPPGNREAAARAHATFVAHPGAGLEPSPGGFASAAFPLGSAAVARIDPNGPILPTLEVLHDLRQVSDRFPWVASLLWIPLTPPDLASFLRGLVPNAEVTLLEDWREAEARRSLSGPSDVVEEVRGWMRDRLRLPEPVLDVIKESIALPLGTAADEAANKLYRHRSTIFRLLQGSSMPTQTELIRLGALLRTLKQLQVDHSVTIESGALAEGFSCANAFRHQFRRRFGVQPSKAREWFGLRPLIARYWGAVPGLPKRSGQATAGGDRE